MEQTLKPMQIIKHFHTSTLVSWTHYEHAIICLDYAMRADNVYTLMHTIRCGFIRHRSKVHADFTIEKCTFKWHETKTWFWCNLFFTLVRSNKTLQLRELVKLADKKGFLDSDFILKLYTREELATDYAKATILQKDAELGFFVTTVVETDE